MFLNFLFNFERLFSIYSYYKILALSLCCTIQPRAYRTPSSLCLPLPHPYVAPGSPQFALYICESVVSFVNIFSHSEDCLFVLYNEILRVSAKAYTYIAQTQIKVQNVTFPLECSRTPSQPIPDRLFRSGNNSSDFSSHHRFFLPVLELHIESCAQYSLV